MNAPDLRPLIRRGRDLAALIKDQEEELKGIKARLIAQAGAGKHAGTDGAFASVSFPAASIKPGDDDVQFCRELLAPDLFEKLFASKTIASPVKAFREVLAVLVPADVAAQVIEHCEEPNAAQVRFS